MRITWSDQLMNIREKPVTILLTGSGQIAVEDGRDGFVRLLDLVVAVVNN